MPKARSQVIPFVVAFAASMVFAAVVVAPSALAKSQGKKCAPIPVGGHVYFVSETHTLCSFAEKWVAKLAGGRLAAHSSNVALSNGPKGFTCQAGTKGSGVAMPGIPSDVQISGNCAKGLGLGPAPYFNWVVKTKY